MAVKYVDLPGLGTVGLYKRRGNRSIRLSVSAKGQIRVSLPVWAPYRAGLEFARTKSGWLAQQLADRKTILTDGQPIGKAHHLSFEALPNYSRINTTIKGSDIIVRYPDDLTPASDQVQSAAHRVCLRALKQEAELLLPRRLDTLAQKHGLTYNSVQVRHLKSRWGSCNSKRDITLNSVLMELPWHLIDYVIVHELVHTKVLRHGPDFWSAFESYMPKVKQVRKEIRSFRPTF